MLSKSLFEEAPGSLDEQQVLLPSTLVDRDRSYAGCSRPIFPAFEASVCGPLQHSLQISCGPVIGTCARCPHHHPCPQDTMPADWVAPITLLLSGDQLCPTCQGLCLQLTPLYAGQWTPAYAGNQWHPLLTVVDADPLVVQGRPLHAEATVLRPLYVTEKLVSVHTRVVQSNCPCSSESQACQSFDWHQGGFSFDATMPRRLGSFSSGHFPC